MVNHRHELNAKLKKLCDNVYFSPPDGKHLEYPCIVYNIEGIDVDRANNKAYSLYTQYRITYMHTNPDKPRIHEFYEEFPHHLEFNDEYITDGLIHEYYILYWLT